MSMRCRTPRSPNHVFRDRREAGRALAELLTDHRGNPDVIVVGLARGGIPVAWEVAAVLGAPLEVFVVRKLGVPGQEEFAFGALAGGGRVVINDDVVRAVGISPQQISEITDRERRELRRREVVYRAGRPRLDVRGKTVIAVDDGLATGASMLAAVHTLRDAGPSRVVVAVPTAPTSSAEQFAGTADEVVSVCRPTPFLAVGQSYRDFTQIGDAQVCELLATPTVGWHGGR